MRVLGIDVAWVRSGWAVTDDGETILATGDEAPQSKDRGDHGLELAHAIRELVTHYQPNACYLEEHEAVSHRKGVSLHTALMLARAGQIVETCLAELSVPCVAVSPQYWRELFCGSSRAGKAAVWRRLRLQQAFPLPLAMTGAWGDRADAMGIAIVGWRLERVRQQLLTTGKP